VVFEFAQKKPMMGSISAVASVNPEIGD